MRIGAVPVLALVGYAGLRLFSRRMARAIIARQLRPELDEEQKKRWQTLTGVTNTAGTAAILIVATVTIISEVGISIGPLLAGVGIAGLAVSLAGQSLIKDVLRGMIIIIDDQYRKGDVVNIAGKSELVEEVGIRRTVIRDLDGIVHYIPNGEITVASNYTREWSRVNLDISVAYKRRLGEGD